MTAQKNEIAVVLDLTLANAVKLFEEKGIFDHIANIREKQESIVYDMGVKNDRDACRSAAAKLAKTKTAIDTLRKDHNEGHRDAISLVNDIGKDAVEQMQTIQDNVRKPLTERENAKKKFEQDQRDRIEHLKSFKSPIDADMNEYSIDQLKARYEELNHIIVDTSYGDFEKEAMTAKQESVDMIEMLVFKKEQAEAEAKRIKEEELEAARLEQIEHDARIRAEATIKANKAAEEAIELAKQNLLDMFSDEAEAHIYNDERDQFEEEQKESNQAVVVEQTIVAKEPAGVISRYTPDRAAADTTVKQEEAPHIAWFDPKASGSDDVERGPFVDKSFYSAALTKDQLAGLSDMGLWDIFGADINDLLIDPTGNKYTLDLNISRVAIDHSE